MNIYNSKAYTIKEVFKQTSDNYMLRIKTNINPLPGQFVEVSIPGIGEAPMSGASYNNKILDLNIRVVGNVTGAAAKLKKGDKVFLRGPYGKGYPMDELKNKRIILIGGGCGVAPLRGAIEYLDQNRRFYPDVKLFFGFRSPEDVLFKDEIANWSIKFDLNMSVDQAAGDNPFECPVGFVTEILEKADLKPKDSAIFICGPPIMMNGTIEILEKKGFKDEQIWVSLERQMKCCTGKCGRCMVNAKYVCTDGPVFRYDEVRLLDE